MRAWCFVKYWRYGDSDSNNTVQRQDAIVLSALSQRDTIWIAESWGRVCRDWETRTSRETGSVDKTEELSKCMENACDCKLMVRAVS